MAQAAERIPRATYRIQFRRDFGFARASHLVDYLARLGISDLYASPLFQARPESTHGYDIVDPRRLDPRFGPEADFEALSAALSSAGMGLLLDIVPNHMAAVPANPWFRDVLEKGARSPFAKFFDIDWSQEKTLVPVLGEPLEEAVENGRLTLELTDRGLAVRYFDRSFPLDPASYPDVLRRGADRADQALDNDDPGRQELARLLDRMMALPASTAPADPEAGAPGARREEVKRRLLELYRSRETLRELIDEAIAELNDTSDDPSRLIALLERQAYRLAFWREAARSLNYRRFFNISDLIGIRVEEPDVFETTHARVLSLVAQGRVSGLRVDHIDGLHDPREYLLRLQSRLAESSGKPGRFYVVVEKILCDGETLPPDWAIAGTTGYDFAHDLAAVFLDPEGISRLEQAYARWTGRSERMADVAYREKARIVRTRLLPETLSLARELEGLAADLLPAGEPRRSDLEGALVEVTACLPIYRTYVRASEISSRDKTWIVRALDEARRRCPSLASIELLGRILLLDFPPALTLERRRQWLDFVKRWQQYTGPAMAKGVEDTAFYVYNPLVSLNEVGSDGEAISVAEFHRRQAQRRRDWPDTLCATSTHDTKRSEDSRARIGVLSELACEWVERFERWSQANARCKKKLRGCPVPDPCEETMLYQNLLGAWPLHEEEEPAFRIRFQAFLVKALREAKIHTRWSDPNLEYEKAVTGFAAAILDPDGDNSFLEDFRRFHERIAMAGALTSLSQTLLKAAGPGVPDFYQGTELWDFSFVDPDNRRPVDFGHRQRLLAALDAEEATDRGTLLRSLRHGWRDGRIKLFLVSRCLRARAADPELFARGDYVALRALGDPDCLVALARRLEERWVIAVCPRFLIRRFATDHPFGSLDFGGARLALPPGAPSQWRDLLTGRRFSTSPGEAASLDPERLLEAFPVALLAASAGPG